MPTIRLTAALRAEYERLFKTMRYTWPVPPLDRIIAVVHEDRDRYVVASKGQVPWLFVAAIHDLESGGQFTKHLHNGDPLTARTVHVPAGRPKRGTPPFTWEESALDAILMHKPREMETLPEVLFAIEGWNGFGYRRYHPEVLSPYLWAGSQHYTAGKYGADGVFTNLVSKQYGAAMILRRYIETFPLDTPTWVMTSSIAEMWMYGEEGPGIVALQEALNKLSGIFIRVDGQAGPKTSSAFYLATGKYLPGDPRA